MKLILITISILTLWLNARADTIGLAAFAVNREATPVVEELAITGNIEQVKTDQPGFFAIPFLQHEPDAYYQVSVTSVDGENIITWKLLHRADNGFSIFIYSGVNPYDPPVMCVVTVSR